MTDEERRTRQREQELEQQREQQRESGQSNQTSTEQSNSQSSSSRSQEGLTKTGDDTNYTPVIVIAVIGVAVIAGAIIWRRKK